MKVILFIYNAVCALTFALVLAMSKKVERRFRKKYPDIEIGTNQWFDNAIAWVEILFMTLCPFYNLYALIFLLFNLDEIGDSALHYLEEKYIHDKGADDR